MIDLMTTILSIETSQEIDLAFMLALALKLTLTLFAHRPKPPVAGVACIKLHWNRVALQSSIYRLVCFTVNLFSCLITITKQYTPQQSRLDLIFGFGLVAISIRKGNYLPILYLLVLTSHPTAFLSINDLFHPQFIGVIR